MLIVLLFAGLFFMCLYLFYTNLILDEKVARMKSTITKKIEQNNDLFATVASFRRRIEDLEQRIKRRSRKPKNQNGKKEK